MNKEILFITIASMVPLIIFLAIAWIIARAKLHHTKAALKQETDYWMERNNAMKMAHDDLHRVIHGLRQDQTSLNEMLAFANKKASYFKRYCNKARKELGLDSLPGPVMEEIDGGSWTITTIRMIDDILMELQFARDKWPHNNHMLTALTEEVGELSMAMLHLHHEPEQKKTSVDVYIEAVQTAVMAIRVATEGDSTFPAYDPEEAQKNAEI